MRRLLVGAAAVIATVVALAIVALLRDGGEGDKTIQTVAGHEITRDDLEQTVEHFHEEAEREGRSFPHEGTQKYERVEKIVLRLLIDQAAIEAAAAKLGVHVTEAQVDARVHAAGGEEEDAGESDGAFARATARTQLVEEAVARILGRGVTASDRTVRAYYRAHRDLYGSAPFAQVAPSIRSQLLAQRRNAVLGDWLAKVRANEPKPKL
jgi:hypothetical protein